MLFLFVFVLRFSLRSATGERSLTVVSGKLVTGQNQNSGCETAQRMLMQLGAKDTVVV